MIGCREHGLQKNFNDNNSKAIRYNGKMKKNAVEETSLKSNSQPNDHYHYNMTSLLNSWCSGCC